MKHLIRQLPLLLALLLLPVLTNGCTTFKTAGVIATTVDGAMNGWGSYVRSGKATPAEEARVKSAYLKYQKSMAVLEAVVKAEKKGDALDASLSAVQAAKNELLDLVAELTK